jgi:Cof subfamily protein (haloacid dehalogenase superfamily)
MRYRLLAVDVDGTLLDSAHRLRPRVIAAVRAAQAAGATITLASGKQLRSLLPLIDRLDLTGPQICLNGAAVMEGLLTPPVAFTPLGEDERRAVIEAVRATAPEALISQFALDAIFVDREHPLMGVFAEYGEQTPTHVPDLLTAALPPAAKILVAGAPDALHDLRRAVTPLLSELVYITSTMPEFLEFFAPGADKGQALLTVRRRLGVAREAVVAIGDGENDAPLFEAAGLAVAMANAAPAVRACARLVAPSNDEDGVAMVIERLLAE